jgi:Protein of unknown function (DUF3128)
MGWWWSSDTSKETPSSPSILPTSADETSPSLLPPALPPEPISNNQPSKSLTTDEWSERELAAWFKELESDSKGIPFSKKFSKPTIPNAGDNPPESLYPTEISCRSAFDYAFFCQSFGGQFVNVYRYGTFRSCSNHWQDFWLCMRTRRWDKQDRERAIADHYRKKIIKYKNGPSSEDVWQMRTEPVKDAFQGDLDALERQLAELRRQNPGAKEPWER